VSAVARVGVRGSGLGLLVWTELKLVLREPIVLIFVFAFPVLTVLVLGGVFDGDGDEFSGTEPAHWYLAAYIGVVIAATGLIMLPVHLAGYRERGVLRRFQVSRFPGWAVPAAHVLVGLVTCAIGAAVVVAVVALTSGVPAPDDWFGTFAGLVLSASAFVSIGVVLGLALPSARSAQGLGMLLFFPFMLLSGAGPPPGAMSDGMRTVSDLIPLTHVIRSIQEPWFGLATPSDHFAVVAGMLVAATATWLVIAVPSGGRRFGRVR
jgi:ABC-2 type transport system permease protein